MLEVTRYGQIAGGNDTSEDENNSKSKSLVTTGLQLTQRGAHAGAAVVQFATGSSE